MAALAATVFLAVEGREMVNVEQLEAAQYRPFVNSRPVAVIQFWAEWDGMFLRQKQQVELAMERFRPGDVRGAMIDTDERDGWPPLHRWCINRIPTLLFYKDGRQTSRLAGYREAEAIRNVISDLLTGEANAG